MRSQEEITQEIKELEEELEQAEYGGYEYDELDRELFVLESELRKVKQQSNA
jgi:hypothetical protein